MSGAVLPAPGEISILDAHAQVDLVRRGEIAPTALVDAAIARIEVIDGATNAVSHRTFEYARDAAKKIDKTAPMAGAPYLLKDSMEYPGFPTASGSRIRKGTVGANKFPFAQRMDAAGLIPCGKSTMPEFGLMGTGEGLLYGPTRNPWNLNHSSGGSSSGAAVAVAAYMTPFATGSDGGGSIRLPASHCGIVGFKPSRNWNLRARAASLIDDFLTSDALFARSMRDTIWAAQFLRAQPPTQIGLDRPLRIALSLRGLDGQLPEPDVANMVAKTGMLCETLGHHVDEASPPLDLTALSRAFDIIWSYAGGEVLDLCHANLGAQADSLLEPWTLGLAARRDTIAPNDLARAFATIVRIDLQLEQFWTEYDVVLSPVASSTAPPIGALAPDRPFEALWRDHFRLVNYTQVQNMAGFPGISLPLFMGANGLPAGAMFWTRHGGDDLLLSLGAALEKAQPWAARIPPLNAIH